MLQMDVDTDILSIVQAHILSDEEMKWGDDYWSGKGERKERKGK